MRHINVCGQILVIPVRLFEYGSVRACEMVDAGELDAALANLDYYNIDDLNHHVVMEDSYVYCVSRTHRFAVQPQITSRFGVVWKKGSTPPLRTSRFISFAAQYELV